MDTQKISYWEGTLDGTFKTQKDHVIAIIKHFHTQGIRPSRRDISQATNKILHCSVCGRVKELINENSIVEVGHKRDQVTDKYVRTLQWIN